MRGGVSVMCSERGWMRGRKGRSEKSQTRAAFSVAHAEKFCTLLRQCSLLPPSLLFSVWGSASKSFCVTLHAPTSSVWVLRELLSGHVNHHHLHLPVQRYRVCFAKCVLLYPAIACLAHENCSSNKKLSANKR